MKFKLTLSMCLVALGAHDMLWAQSISFKKSNVSLPEVFKEIGKQSGYDFIYAMEEIKGIKPIQVDFKNASLNEVLAYCLKNQPISYEIKNNSIILKKKVNFSEVNKQQSAIEGRITDEKGKPLGGVTIVAMINNTKNTKLTDQNGRFKIETNESTATLEISYIGYTKMNVKAQAGKPLDVKMQPLQTDMDEVVVTGLYSRPTENFTGAATTVSGQQLRDVNAMNVFDALKVFDPAVRIPDNIEFGSDPNQLPKISLRGTNNFPGQGQTGDAPMSGADFMAAYQSNPSMPLFILDGFEVSLQKVYDLDINRIENMVILKDAVATSAYGSRAANGVIVVNTKQPKPGKLTLSYSTTMQVTAPDLTSYNLLNAADKLELERIGGLYRTSRPENQLILDQRYSNRRAAVESGVDTYWLSQPLQTGVGTKQSLYVDGGDSYIRYGASFGYTNNKGVMKGSGRSVLEGGMDLSYRRDNLIVRNQLNISSNTSNNSPYGSFGDYSRMNPYWNPFDEQGNIRKSLESIASFGVGGTTEIANPLYNANIGTLNQSKYSGMSNNTMLEWRMGNGLKVTGKFSFSNQKDESNVFLPADHTAFSNIKDYDSDEYVTRGSYNRSNSSFFNYDGSVTLDYNKLFGKNLIYATLGGALAQQQSKATAIVVRGFPNNRLDELFYGNEFLKNSRPSGQNNISRRVSSFANLNYSYDQRYLFDLALNVDGSTQFGELNRFAPFWAVGLGWNLHEEEFMAQSKTILNRLKLRAGLGTTGSQQFPPYMALTTYAYNTSQDFLGMYGASVLGYGNQNLKWQETLKYNLGADMDFLNERVMLRLDAYYELTNNLLLDINTPPSLGVSTYKENMGKLANRGIEGGLRFFIFKPKANVFSWSVNVNAINNKNWIKEISNSLEKMNEANDNPDNKDQTRPQQRYQEGQSVNAIWAVRSAGIDPSTGQELYYDRNGELTYIWNAADKVIVGDGFAKLSGSIGSNITYKGFQLGAYFSYQLGAKQYNSTLADHVENADISYNVDRRVYLDRWQKPGDLTFFKGLTDVEGQTITSATNATSRFMQKNNYLNFTSISLGYNLPEKWSNKWKLKNTRVSVQGNNILQLSTIQIERGLSYPFARNFNFSLNTSF